MLNALLTSAVYVTAVYFVFQILTRSDDMEILSHLPATSSLRSALPHPLSGSNMHSDLPSHNPYALPYHLPHIPSPIPKVENGSSFWRVALGVLVYPIYLIIALVAIPLPLLFNLLHLLTSVLGTVLYPLTSTARFLTRTFLLAPLSLLHSIFEAFYPIISFIGGVIGLGCIMGFGAGWAGKLGLDWLLGRNKGGKKRSSAVSRSSKSQRFSKSRTSRGSTRRRESETDQRGLRHSDSGSGHEMLVTPTASRRSLDEDAYIMPSKLTKGKARDRPFREGSSEYVFNHAETYATAREPQVVGTRRRTHAFETR